MAEDTPEEQDDAQQEAQNHETPPPHPHPEIPEDEAAILQFQQILGDSIEGDKNVDRFSDVPLKIAIELGRVNRPIREILDFKEGSIIETKKLSGQPMEVMVNDRLFGRGEVVVVGDNLAIRITDLKKPDLT